MGNVHNHTKKYTSNLSLAPAERLLIPQFFLRAAALYSDMHACFATEVVVEDEVVADPLVPSCKFPKPCRSPVMIAAMATD